MMSASGMAQHVIRRIDQIDNPIRTNNVFYDAVCEYVEENAVAIFDWEGVSPKGSPDPVKIIKAGIKTCGSLSPVGTTTPSATIAAWTSVWNANISTWTIDWPEDFKLAKSFVIPTVSFSLSYAAERTAAVTALCESLVNGIKLATPSEGDHDIYTGPAISVRIE